MYTVYLNSKDQGHDLSSFKDKMIQICNDHRDTGRAIAFAFILYDFENPQLWKVLNDRHYWLALNQISGEYLTVFSLNYDERKQRRNKFGGDYNRQRISGNFTEMLTSISTNYNPIYGSNELIDRYFGKELKVKYPAILFFQVNNCSVIDSLLIELKEEQIEPAFLELKGYIQKAAESLKKHEKKYESNISEVFDCLEKDIKRAKNSRKIKRVVQNGGNIIGLISSIKGLF
jgi:hypothetical protein